MLFLLNLVNQDLYTTSPSIINFKTKILVLLSVLVPIAKYLNLFKIGGGPYFLVGQTNNFLEMGIDVYYLVVDEVSDDQKGFAIVYPNYSVQSYYATFNLGYRHISTTKLYRIGISPGFIKNDFVPGAYLSFGILF
jgi:hypothetical protein